LQKHFGSRVLVTTSAGHRWLGLNFPGIHLRIDRLFFPSGLLVGLHKRLPKIPSPLLSPMWTKFDMFCFLISSFSLLFFFKDETQGSLFPAFHQPPASR
jgi:hypothetical protein